jgi:hypothetical protein
MGYLNYRQSSLVGNTIATDTKVNEMKKITMAVLVVVLVIPMMSTGCFNNPETKQYGFSDFNRVEVGYAFQVEISKASSYSISVTADGNLFEYIQVAKEGETLKIGLERDTNLGPVTLKAEVTLPQLRGVKVSGATRGTVSGFSSTENLDIKVSGASLLNLVDISAGDVRFEVSGASRAAGDLAASDVNFDLSGASTVQLKGSAIDIIVEASGASDVDLATFLVDNADVKLSGDSRLTVELNGILNADLSRASELYYIGEPTMGEINTSGDSTLRHK